MSTAGAVVDRVLRDYLTPADNQPTQATLASAIADASTTSVSYSDDELTPEEEDLLGPGVVVEVDQEQMRVTAVDSSANTLTVIRGVNGTTAAAHSSGADLIIAPTWARRVVFDAVADAIGDLSPELYTTATTSVTLASNTYTEVPATVDKALRLWYQRTGSTGWQEIPFRFYEDFPPSSTTKAIQAGCSGSAHLLYRKSVSVPTAEADTLADLGVDSEWVRIVVLGAVAYLIAGRDLDRTTADLIGEQLEAQQFPAGQGLNLTARLLAAQNQYMERAKNKLRAKYPAQVKFNKTVVRG